VSGQTKIGRLLLAVAPNLEINLVLTFNGARPTSLAGKTITWQATSAGATGKFTVVGDNVVAGVTDGEAGFFKLV
jgi:hypothetical protein